MRTLLTLAITLSIISLHGQSVERENTTTCIISDKFSSIDSAVGWAVTSDGYWMKSKNRLPNAAKELENVKLGYNSWYETGTNNFLTIQLRKVTIKEKEYILYIRKYITGEYKYPSINEGWEGYNAYDFYVFEKEELTKLFDNTRPLNVAYEVKFNSVYCKVPFGYGDKDINIDKIKEWIGKFIANPRIMLNTLTFQVFPVETKNGKVVRFNFENSLSNSASKFDPKSFDKKYFEVPFDEFSSFIFNAQKL